MWMTKTFRTEQLRKKWIERNKNKYRIDIIFVNNGYGIEYKKLVKI